MMSGGVTTTGCFFQNTTGTMNINDMFEVVTGPFRSMANTPNNLQLFVDAGGCYAGCGAIFNEHQYCVYGPGGANSTIDRISLVAPGSSTMTGWAKLEKLQENYSQ